MLVNQAHKKWWALVGISLACFVGFIDFAIVNTALPAIQLDLSASMLQLQWMINLFGLTLSVFMVSMGRFADIYGRRRLNTIGLIIFGLSSLLAGLADNADWLILFRACQGIGIAFVIPCSLALIAHTFPEAQRGRAMGIWGSITGFGLALGPVMGGFITHYLSWHWIFFINVPIVIASLIICSFSVEESKNGENTKVDTLGFITLTTALSTFIVAIMQGHDWGWHSSAILSLFALSIIASVLFYIAEKNQAFPLIKFELFKNRTFFACAVAAFALMFFIWPAFFFAPLFLHTIHQETMRTVGLMLLPTTAALAVFSSLVGIQNDRVGAKIPIVTGLILILVASASQLFFQAQTPIWFLMLSFFIMGLAWAFIAGPKTVAALAALPAAAAGIASGVLWTIQDTGGVIGLAISGAVFRHQEKAALFAQLHDRKLVLQLLVNPATTNQVIATLAPATQQQIPSLLATAFLHGLHSAMLLLFSVALLSLLIVVWAFSKRSKS